MTDDSTHVTELVAALAQSGADAKLTAEELMPLVYDELRRLASSYVQRERARPSLQATALVNEAYLKLVDQSRADWRGRTHFFAVSATVMRRLLVDHARRRDRHKRGFKWERVTLAHGIPGLEGELDADELLHLNEVLERLFRLDARQAQIVELRFFCGLTVEEVAEALGLSKRSVEGDWMHARVWLKRELSGAG